MQSFDPSLDVDNASAILDEEGKWPNFHDAVVNEVHFDRGDIRPDDDVWDGAVVEVVLTLTAYREPYDVRLLFSDCDEIKLGVDGQFTAPDIFDLTFEYLDRGTLIDGVTPLKPLINVVFESGAGIALNLKCFGIRAERLPAPSRQY